MAEKPIVMPKMGESIAEATIIRWLKNEGDRVEKDEPIVEIATDKVDSEIPSTEAGILVKQMYKDGDVVKVGEPVAMINTEGGASAVAPAPTAAPATTPVVETPVAVEAAVTAIENQIQAAQPAAEPLSNADGSRFYSPLVLNIARTEGVSMSELETVPGTGKEGRVTKSDILAYVANRGNVQPAAAAASVSAMPVAPVATTPAISTQTPAKVEVKSHISLNPGDELIEMDRVRKLIADHMVMSKHTSPHVTSFVEADVTNLVNWRNRVKDSFKKREGENITFTPIFIEAVAKAIKDFPMINVSVDGTTIIKRKNINVGMAVAQQNGNLIVPVIKNADTMNLLGLTRAVNELANRARIGKLTPDEIQGGTYTLTNVGSFGNVLGTPVINQPQVAIMAVGAIRKKPAVLETEYGDVIAIRHMMYLSHSYDHRVVDGALGGMFVRRVADYLEQWDVNREI
ncbi:MAG: dihydrolipoamide acetyltransferase family protein [Bacteroidota bacterium]|jgi:2-oxoglutarate dehydrogenase E2 component (dihydrolipoamide succinyltransferase)|nr:2-oxo acid dehydrogenase subunit E2 [Bacteroidota bacterium]